MINKRIMAILLVVVMCAAMLPMSVAAVVTPPAAVPRVTAPGIAADGTFTASVTELNANTDYSITVGRTIDGVAIAPWTAFARTAGTTLQISIPAGATPTTAELIYLNFTLSPVGIGDGDAFIFNYTFEAEPEATPTPAPEVTPTPGPGVTTTPPPGGWWIPPTPTPQPFNVVPERVPVERVPIDRPPVEGDDIPPIVPGPPVGDVIIPASVMFDDVLPGAWYYDYVSLVASRGIFAGTGPRRFDPALGMTRAMFTRAVGNLEGVNWDLTSTQSPFSDVDVEAWYATAISWASGQNLVQGVGGNNFAPSVNITREQMAVLLYRYAQARNIPLPATVAATPFVDQGDVSDWATDAVRAIQQVGIIQGRPGGQFDPQATATRAEVAAIFARFLPHVN